jgi:hypothetical protein
MAAPPFCKAVCPEGSMVEFDPATGLFALPVWLVAAVAALIAVLAAFSIWRAGAVRILVSIAVLGVLGSAGWLGWAAIVHSGGAGANAGGSQREERRLFEARVNDLVGRAMMPGSPLACLDGNAGDQVAEGCEKLIFAGADTTAAAVSYLSARLAMLTEGTELAAASGLSYDKPLDVLRRGLENDRYGIVAYLMLQDPDCKPEHCASLALVRDANRVRVNLLEKPFDVLVARYAANWQSGSRSAGTDGRAVAAAPPPPATSGAGVPVSSKYDFPSAASIPPVSIMNPEPATPAAKTEAKAEPKPAAAPKPAPQRHAAPKPAPKREAAAPTQLAPAAATPAATAERPAPRQQ